MLKAIDDLNLGFRAGMRTLASGVCVITAVNERGERAAMTASSVTSLSDNPPSLLVCVNSSARMHAVMADSPRFAVNVLASHQQKVSEICAFAEQAEERFKTGAWHCHQDLNMHYLNDAMAAFSCQKSRVIEYGTHHIYIGNIEAVFVATEKQPPLIYVDGQYLSN